MENEIAVYSEVVKTSSKTKLIKTELKSKSYYENDNIVFYTTEQLKTLLNSITNDFHKLIILLLYETGARVEEARELRFADVESSTGRIKVLTLKQRKNNKIYRYLKISDKLMSLILSHRLEDKLNDNDFILAKEPNGKAIDRKSITYALKYNTLKLFGKENLYKAHPHALRHSRAIHLLDAGMNIMLLKNFLGHSNISNTLIYLKYSNKDLAEAVDKANSVFV